VFNSRKVSQERVMGISFVDILIQAVFLLLLILMVGYVDPLDQQIKFEFSEAGKDLCNKLDKDSPVACVEYIKDKDVNVSKAGPKPVDPSQDFCKNRELSPEECKNTLDKMASDINLWPCIPPSSTTQLTKSTFWIISAPGEIEFNRFSKEYIKYLSDKGFTEKLSRVEAINASGKKVYSPNDVISTFGFIREDHCFHEHSISRTGKFSDSDLAKDTAAIRSLRGG
jgi:hypothetical protein